MCALTCVCLKITIKDAIMFKIVYKIKNKSIQKLFYTGQPTKSKSIVNYRGMSYKRIPKFTELVQCTGWFQERVRVRYHDRSKIHGRVYVM